MTTRSALTLSALLAAAAMSVGCTAGSTTMDQRSDVIWDQTPNMASLTQTWDLNTNQFMYTCNTNLHLAVSDFDRMMLIDRPSRMTFIERIK
ncbi:MAG: hypothetical protein ACREJO_15325 [Phycisphaerales bacterium]